MRWTKALQDLQKMKYLPLTEANKEGSQSHVTFN